MSCFWDDPAAFWDDASCAWDGVTAGPPADGSTYPAPCPRCDQTVGVGVGVGPSTFPHACPGAPSGTRSLHCTGRVGGQRAFRCTSRVGGTKVTLR